ncbi:MAG TPA: hypothetical protein VLC48_03835, partial [Gemmatimonadota bacterium]|nr:hypothetical protein [Gemmatimonadota bacterium]
FLSALKRAAPENTVAQEAYEIAARAVLHPGDLRSLTQAIDRVLRLNPTARDLTWQVRRAAENPLAHLSLALPEPSQRELVAWLRPRVVEDPRDAYRVTLLGRLLIASGRIAAGWQFLDSLEADPTIPWSYRQRASLLPSDLGYVDELYYERTGRELSDGARLRVAMLAAIDRGQPGGLREMIDQARARERETDAPIWGTRAAASEGFLRALEGEPVAGLAQVDSALVEYSWSTEPFRLRWLEWLVRYPETRAQARPLLDVFWPGEPAYVVPRYYVRGRLLEAEGDTAAALQSFGRFLAIVSDADPGLLLQVRVDSARAAMQRLSSAESVRP